MIRGDESSPAREEESMAQEKMAEIHRDTRDLIQNRDNCKGNTTTYFEKISELWSAYLGVEISPVEVAEMLVLQEVARSKVGSSSKDHYQEIIDNTLVAHGLNESL